MTLLPFNVISRRPGRDRVNGAAFLTSFQEGPHQKLFFQGFFFQNSASKMANCTIVEVSYVITGKLLTTHF